MLHPTTPHCPFPSVRASSLSSHCVVMLCICNTGSAPKLSQLMDLKLKVGGNRLKVIQSVAADWKLLGLALEFDYAMLMVIERSNLHLVEDSCLDLLHRWLSGEACQPITWERLIEALREVGQTALAAKLEDTLQFE